MDEGKAVSISSEWGEVLPWFLPAVMLSAIVSVVIGRSLARLLRLPQSVAWGVVFAFGLILSATLTPLGDLAEVGRSGSCDVSRVGLPPLDQLRRVNDVSLNVLLFTPLGFAIGLIPRSRTKAGLFVAAIALPACIEAVQLLAPLLGRGCQTADVFDNLGGLILGFGAGTLAMRAGSGRGLRRT